MNETGTLFKEKNIQDSELGDKIDIIYENFDSENLNNEVEIKVNKEYRLLFVSKIKNPWRHNRNITGQAELLIYYFSDEEYHPVNLRTPKCSFFIIDGNKIKRDNALGYKEELRKDKNNKKEEIKRFPEQSGYIEKIDHILENYMTLDNLFKPLEEFIMEKYFHK